MRIGHQPQPAAAGAHRVEKRHRARQGPDALANFSLEHQHVEPGHPAPMVGAVPRQRVLGGDELRQQAGIGLVATDAVQRCITLEHQGAPKVIVVGEVQNGAVHVEHDQVYLRPVDLGIP